MLAALLIAAVLLLAFVNGANDNSKGVATLFGSGTSRWRAAIVWGTVSTAAGALVSVALAGRLLDTFSGKGIVPAELVGGEVFLAAVAAGAGLTVLLASRVGLPISTTHALVGGLVGAGLVRSGGQVQLAALMGTLLLPLLTSPLLAAALAALLRGAGGLFGRRFGLAESWCACAPLPQAMPHAVPMLVGVSAGPARHPQLAAASALLRIDRTEACARDGATGVSAAQVRDGLHWISAGVVGFSRGVNDAPKIAAMLLAAPALHGGAGVLAVAATMAAGGLLAARRVGNTMALGITRLDPARGLAANLATGIAVLGASSLGLPVSTTHVSVGALAGAGEAASLRTGKLRTVLLAWVVTLPLSATLAAGAAAVLGGVRAG